jgi:hypothetical protein
MDYFLCNRPATYRDWLQTIDYLGEMANIPMLTIRIHFADYDPFGSGDDDAIELEENESRNIIDSYARAIKPLSILRTKGLKRFFVELPLPATAKSLERKASNVHDYKVAVSELQLWVERLVMGSEYDSRSLPIVRHEDADWYLSPFQRNYYDYADDGSEDAAEE